MALRAVRIYQSYEDQADIAVDETGKVILLDPNSYPSTLASVTHNVTITDVDYPGGSIDLASCPLVSTSNYPNNPPIYGVKSPWLLGSGVANSYYRTASKFTVPDAYRWRIGFDSLRLHISSGGIYWKANFLASKSTYPGLSTIAYVTWSVRKYCTASDYGVYGNYDLYGSITETPSGQGIFSSSAGWGITVSAS